MTSYSPGLHITGDIHSSNLSSLSNADEFKFLVDALISNLGLTKVGEIYHAFTGGGFTGVICLTESHISVHTWPEYGRATFDVFLSNYQKNNDAKANRIFDEIAAHFHASEIIKQSFRR